MKKSFFIFLTLIGSLQSLAQNNDELWAIWQDETETDSARFYAFNRYIYAAHLFSQPDSAFIYAQLYYDEAQRKERKIDMGIASNIQGITYAMRSNPKKAEEYYTKSLKIYEALNHNRRANVLGNLGTLKRSIGEYEEAIDYLNRSIEIKEEINDTSGIASSLNTIGGILNIQGKPYQTIEHFREALVLYEAVNNNPGIAAVCDNIGIWYRDQHQLDQAIDFLYRAKSVHEASNNQRGLSSTISNIANIYLTLDDYEKAMEFYNQAIEINKSTKNKNEVAFILLTLADHHRSKSSYSKALEYANESLEIAKKTSYLIGEGEAYGVLGAIYTKKKEYTKASEYLEAAFQIANRLNNQSGLVRHSNFLAEFYSLQGQHSKAIKLIEQALTIAKERGKTSDRVSAAQTAVSIYLQASDFPRGTEAFDLYINSSDSLKNETNQRTVLRQEYKYEYEKQALADSLEFAQKEAITNLELERNQATLSQQRLGLVATILGLLLLGALAYFFYQSKKREEAEANRVKELDAFKSTFYTNITHEFRTPLTVILGMNQQLKEQPENFLDEATKLIERNGKNLLSQINQILDLSKLETNSLQLNMIQSDIVEFLRYSTEAFQSFANGQNLSLRFFSLVDKLLMDYDPKSIQNIMSNLISNAMKFTPDGGDVKVSVENTKEQITIKVEDTGVGISDKDLPHVFDRFYQVENAQDTLGTGVGLAYVKALIQALGGTLAVESKLNEGSTFSVQLPIHQTAALAEKIAPTNSELSWKQVQQRVDKVGETKVVLTETTTEQGNKNLPQLLLIEDNPDVVIYLKSCLADQYNIEVAYNGRIGIEKAIETIPDLIISDVMMPEKNGFEVCEVLKTDERTSHIPLILLTAKADVSSKIAGLKRGADAYLAKPFEKEELLVRLEKLVERQQRMVSYFSKNKQSGLIENVVAEVIEMEDIFIKKINSILEVNIGDEDFGLPQLCQKVRMSRSQLFRKMKALTDTAPSAFIKSYRLQKAKYLLENTEMNVAEAAYEVGFKDPSYFSKIFQEEFGITPSATGK